jgi:hypothetical protein
MRIDEIWGKQSIDFIDGITPENLESKREDSWYPRLRDHIFLNGIEWPVTMYKNFTVFGNGHHRLAAFVELGYTHFPVQDDLDMEYAYDSEPDNEWDN